LPLDSRPGITEWEGETFDPSVRKARRIYPHFNDTGGFFVAKLEVTA
jgi:16S rRNA C967 or C1407 C5-methylase (RsmB/RsmF family)